MISMVMPSKAKNDTYRRMTQYAVLTAIEAGVDEVIVVEQVPNIKYAGAKVILNEGEFNYNNAMNKGIAHCKGDYIAMVNNDMYFYPGFSQIQRVMRDNAIVSASPYCLNRMPKEKTQVNKYMPCGTGEKIVEGWRVGYELLGYAIVIHRSVLNKIGGKIDEGVKFWWSESLYANQLKKAGIKHHLVCNIFVDHFESMTLNDESKEQKRKLMTR